MSRTNETRKCRRCKRELRERFRENYTHGMASNPYYTLRKEYCTNRECKLKGVAQ